MSQGRRSGWWLAAGGVGLLFLAFCLGACLASETAQVTPTPTKTSRPVPALPTATLTPALINTATEIAQIVPTVTDPPPTETALPQPTAELTPTASPVPTVNPNVCPLTGLAVSDPSLLERRPVAIKIQNAAMSRPQYGLPQADIVYEHLTEAAITRFTAIYLCQDVGKVGSTRSARFIDLEIPAMYRSILAFSGTSPGLYPKFTTADFKEREFVQNWGWHAEAFFRDTELRKQGVPIEHTLFVDARKVWQTATKIGINQRQELSGLSFDRDIPAGGQPATHIHIPFPSRDMVVDWRYDAASGVYLRWVEGKPFLDAASGQQITATNVIVVYATHVDADFYEDYPRTNWPSVQIQLWGTGPAIIFRDGQALKGLWARPQRDDMVVFRDEAGQVPLPLKPGNTWIELVPLPGHRWSFAATWDAKE